jgi:hypothetical protein
MNKVITSYLTTFGKPKVYQAYKSQTLKFYHAQYMGNHQNASFGQ